MKVAIFSDSPTGITAYAKVARNLGVRLARDHGHEVSFGGFQYSGEPIDIQVDGVKTTMFEASTELALKKGIENLAADVVLHVRDSWNMTGLSPAPYKVYPYCVKVGSKLVNYSPVDATPVPQDVINTPCDFSLTMTEWGMNVLIAGGVPPHKCGYLYHGVDTSVYHKMDRKECKSYFGFNPDRPLVGYVGANLDYRKMLPVAMVVFKKVLEKIPDADLCMWTVPLAFWNLDLWRKSLGIKEKVFFPNQTMTWGASEKQMAMLYNAFDVDLNVATAEGFGLPLLEAMACGTKIVCTDTPVLREVLGGYPAFIRSYRNFPFPTGLLEWTIDVDDAAEKVVDAMRSPEKEPPARVKELSWDAAAKKLDTLVGAVALSDE